MPFISQPAPISSENQIIGVLSPYYVIADYNTNPWNNIRVDLWIWKGAHTAVTSSDPNFVLNKYKLNNDDTKLEINIADFVKDTIDPFFSPFNGLNNTSNNSFFYYEVRYFNDSTLVNTTQSTLLLGTLGWRYDYQTFSPSQQVGGEFFPNAYSNNEFSYFNLNSKQNYYKYSEQMTLNNDRIWYTNMSFPISNSTTSVQYVGLVSQLEPNQIVCQPYNYGIGFINKSGNWDTFPVFGKVTISVDKTSTKYRRGFRYKTDYTASSQKSVMEVNNFEEVRYQVNTGVISEVLSVYLESIMYSPKLFVIDYDKNIAYPVTMEDSTFDRKNIWNDKNKISHTLTFVGDNSKKLIW